MPNKKLVALVLLIGICLIGAMLVKTFFMVPAAGDYHNITDLESAYNADAEIVQAMEKLKASQGKAAVIAHSNNSQRQIALTFDGLTDRVTVQKLLDLLNQYQVKATFFVDGMQTAEDPQTVVAIKQAGHRVENYTLSGLPKMESLPTDRLIKDFCRAQKIIKVTTDQAANLLKCNDTKYTDQLLQAAKAAGFNSVVKSDVFIDVKKLNSLPAADNFVGSLRPGSIVSIKLKPNPDAVANEPGKTDLKPAIDKQPGLKVLPQTSEAGEKDIVGAVERLCIALNAARYTTVYVESFFPISPSVGVVHPAILKNSANPADRKTQWVTLLEDTAAVIKKEVGALFFVRKAYAAELAERPLQEIKVISTTEPVVAYTFGGLANEAAVQDVLNRLQTLGIRATFFVAEVEMQRYPQVLRKIIAHGHEIGIAIRPKDGETLEETRAAIIRSRKRLQEQFGITTNLVKQPWGAVTETTKAAVASLDCVLIGQSVNVVQTKHKDYTSAEQVMGEIFGKAVFSLARGQIVHFRMDFYTHDALISELLEAIKQQKVDNIAYAVFYDNPATNPANVSQYRIEPVGEILSRVHYIYTYPVMMQNVPFRLRADYSWQSRGPHNFLHEASKRYIGNADVTYEDRMIGFSKMEARRLDTSGVVHTEQNVIFLTFDDWGTDAAVNKILYVLRKHHVPATFFVLTHNVLNNPNLLRAIAMEGHEIGSHSDLHKPMAVRNPRTGKQVPSQGKEEYRQELAASYQKLMAVTGDVIVNGKPALTRFFRPPTLAISKMGLEALFDTGYEYIISGSCSTYDYKAESVGQLVGTIKAGIFTKTGEVRKGSILVMHMGDGVVYTPMALDILLTANEAKADSDPSKFKVGRLSDYIVEGYSQMDRNHSLKLTGRHES